MICRMAAAIFLRLSTTYGFHESASDCIGARRNPLGAAANYKNFNTSLASWLLFDLLGNVYFLLVGGSLCLGFYKVCRDFKTTSKEYFAE